MGFSISIDERLIFISFRQLIIATLSLILLILLSTDIISDDAEAEELNCIGIRSDSDFETAYEVRSGNGTEDNPYLINDWEINNPLTAIIIIEDTTKHFIVRNITMNASLTFNRFSLDNVRNGTFENITLYGRARISCSVTDSQNITLRNITIRDGGNVYFSNNDDCELTDVDLSEGPSFIFIAYCNRINVTRGNCSGNNGYGYSIRQSNDINIIHSNSSNHATGLYAVQCERVSVHNCTFIDNFRDDLVMVSLITDSSIKGNTFGTHGILVAFSFTLDVDLNNTVDGKPLQFHTNLENVTIDGNAGQVYLGNCTNITITNLTMVAKYPINIWSSRNCEIWNITTADVHSALRIRNTTNLTIHDCMFNISALDYYDKRGLDITETWNLTIKDIFIEGNVTSGGLIIGGVDDRNVTVHIVNVTTRTTGAYDINVADVERTIIENCTGDILVTRGNITEVSNCTEGRVRLKEGEQCTVRDCSYQGFDGPPIWIETKVFNVSSNTVTDCFYGIYVVAYDRTWAGTIQDNVISNCYWGLYIMAANTNVTGNHVDGCVYGVALEWDDMTMSDSIVSNCTKTGIMVRGKNIVIINCTVENVAGTGIDSKNPLSDQSYANITECVIINCTKGIVSDGDFETITLNMIIECTGYGIATTGGQSKIYLNTFEKNNYDASSGTYNGLQASDRGANEYDNGAHGNYWSDYTTRYPNAQTSDGRVWDTPYALAGGFNRDDYPLVNMIDLVRPVADAGEDETVPQNTTVTFDGTGSSDDVGIDSLSWNFAYGGRPISLSNIIDNHTFDIPGVYNVVLTVWDAFGNMDIDIKVVTVLDLDPPVAMIEPEMVVDMGAPFYLDATQCWDNQGIVEYLWSIDPDGLNITRVGERVSVTIEEPGEYDGTLKLTDPAGHWTMANFTITVRDIVPPVADAGPDQTVDQGSEMTFDGSSCTDNVGVVTWRWVIRMPEGSVTLYGVHPTFVFNESGEYLVTLEVSDAAGKMALDTITVTVQDTEAPIAIAGEDQYTDEGGELTFDAKSSSDNEWIALYTWSFEYSGEQVNLPTAQATWTFQQAGVYQVVLRVEDAQGNWAEDQLMVTVRDITPPRADAGVDMTVDQGEEVAFDGGESVDNVGVVSWEWRIADVPDVVTKEGMTVSYVFEVPGVYDVTLMVKDAVELEDFVTITVTVMDSEDPIADAGEDGFVFFNNEHRFDGSGSTDNVAIVRHRWNFTYDGSEEVMTGSRPSFLFAIAGEYTVTLSVEDAQGNSATNTVVITVRPEEFELTIGPFLDANGKPVPKAVLRITFKETYYTGTTDDEGFVDLQVKWVDLSSPANVTLTKDGWKDLFFDLELDENGQPIGPVPTMERKKTEESPHLGAITTLVAICLICAISQRRKR